MSQKWNPTIAFADCGIYTTLYFMLHVTTNVLVLTNLTLDPGQVDSR
jgi:hypothetical protein